MNIEIIEQTQYNTFTVDNINYRSSKVNNGCLLEKQINGQTNWTTVGTAENQLAIDKYKEILTMPSMHAEMKDKLLSAIVSQTSINDMLKKNRKRSNNLLDSLMKRL